MPQFPISSSAPLPIPSRFKFEENIGDQPQRERSDFYRAQHVANRLWSQLAPRYWPGQTQPTMDFQNFMASGPAISGGQYDPATQLVGFSGGLISRLAGHGGGKPFTPAASVLAHEWAHRFQNIPPQLMLPSSKEMTAAQRLREGGAVGFTRAALPAAFQHLGWRGPLDSIVPSQAGGENRRTGQDYWLAYHQAMAKYGPDFFTKRQFRG